MMFFPCLNCTVKMQENAEKETCEAESIDAQQNNYMTDIPTFVFLLDVKDL